MATFRDRQNYSGGRSGKQRSSRDRGRMYGGDTYGRGSGSWEERERYGSGGGSQRSYDYDQDRGFTGMSDFSGSSEPEGYFGSGSGPDYGSGYTGDRPDFGSGRGGSYGSGYGSGRSGSYGGGEYGSPGRYGSSGYGSSRSGSGYGGGYSSGRTGGSYDYDRDYSFGSDYPESERGYRQDYRGGTRDDRGWWDKASDEVASWFGDDEAERRREMDERRGEHWGRGPKNYTRSDDRIKEDINDRLTDHSFLDASDIDVEVENGEVTLSGNVDSRWAKRMAEDIADGVSGVKNVENRIRYNQERTTPSLTGGRSYESTGGQTYGSTGSETSGTTTDTGTKSSAASGDR